MKTQKRIVKGNTTDRLFLLAILLCIFMGALNLINRYYYCIYIAVALFLLTPNRTVRVNGSVLTLLLFSMSLLAFNPDNQDTILDMIKPFVFPVCYMIGFGLFKTRSNEPVDLEQEEKNTALVIYALAGGAMAHFLLNMATNIDATDRNVIDFWTGKAMSATGQAALACLMSATAIVFLFTDVGKMKKIFAIVMLALIISYNLILAGRTAFVLMVIIAAFALLCVCYLQKRKIIKTVIVVLLAAVVLFILYERDAFGIKTTFENSNFYYRFYGKDNAQGMDEDARMAYKQTYLKYLFDYLWGGGNIRNLVGHSAHDLYLDTYDESGIFALITIVIYIISSVVRAIKCFRKNNISVAMRVLVACVYLSCNIQFWLEPITRGMPWLLAAYCFIDGAVTYLLSRESMYARSAASR